MMIEGKLIIRFNDVSKAQAIEGYMDRHGIPYAVLNESSPPGSNFRFNYEAPRVVELEKEYHRLQEL